MPDKMPAETKITPRRRVVDWASLALLVSAVPHVLLSLLLVAAGTQVLVWLAGIPGWPVVAVWMLAGLLVLDRRTAEPVLRWLYGLRRPDPAEQSALEDLWQEVADRAGIDPSSYDLWIEVWRSDSSVYEGDAEAAATHLIILKEHLVKELADGHENREEVAALLAHEVGHHQLGHAAARALLAYYQAPALHLARLLSKFARPRQEDALFWIACGTSAFMALFFLPGLLALVVLAVTYAAARCGEHAADQFAVDLGYGPPLADRFTRRRSQGLDPQPHRIWLGRLVASYPPLYRRIEAIRAAVDARMGDESETGNLPRRLHTRGELQAIALTALAVTLLIVSIVWALGGGRGLLSPPRLVTRAIGHNARPAGPPPIPHLLYQDRRLSMPSGSCDEVYLDLDDPPKVTFGRLTTNQVQGEAAAELTHFQHCLITGDSWQLSPGHSLANVGAHAPSHDICVSALREQPLPASFGTGRLHAGEFYCAETDRSRIASFQILQVTPAGYLLISADLWSS